MPSHHGRPGRPLVTSRSAGRVIASAGIGAALNPLNSTMVVVALPAISAEFGAAASSVTLLVVTGYLVVTLFAQMPAGSIADRIGYGRALTWGRWLFLAGAISGAMAPRLGAVVAGRVLMAVGGSLIIPTAMALLRVTVPAERRARAFGSMGAVLSGAAAIGPALGAWTVTHFGWRSLFLINLPLLLVSWLLQPPLGGDVRPAQVRQFHWREVLPVSLFHESAFSAAAGIIALQNLAMYSLLVQIPFLFGSASGLNSGLGLAIIAMTATMALTSPVGGWLVEWVGTRTVVVSGGLLGALGVLLVSRLPLTASPFDIGARLLLVGVGIGLSTGPSQAVALTSVPLHQSGIASATISMMRYVGSVVGTAILGFAFAGGAESASWQHVALWVFSGAFVLSAALGATYFHRGNLRDDAQEPGVPVTPGDRR
jgi:MFS family permease